MNFIENKEKASFRGDNLIHRISVDRLAVDLAIGTAGNDINARGLKFPVHPETEKPIELPVVANEKEPNPQTIAFNSQTEKLAQPVNAEMEVKAMPEEPTYISPVKSDGSIDQVAALQIALEIAEASNESKAA